MPVATTHLYSEQMMGAADSGQYASGVLLKLSSCSTFASLALLLQLLDPRSAAASLESKLSGYLAS
jgi:hypothetical protein